MKTTTPKKVSQRDKVVDSMAKKFADRKGVSQIITAHRKRKLRPEKYVYIFIGMAAISTVFTTLIMTGKIAPGILNPEQGAPAAPIKSTLDLLNDDFTEQKISADQYALFIKDYLIRYDSLPAHYKTSRITINSTEMYAALHTMWPRVNLRTRSDILKIMPFLEQKWQSLNIQAEQNE